MATPVQDIAVALSQYDQEWLAYVARLDHKLQLLQTLKRGMELLLLVGSYLIYYLLDCIAAVMALPLPLVR